MTTEITYRNNGAIVLPAAQFTPVGWTPGHDLSYDEWREVGAGMARVGAAVNWWIGDWIRFGERKYGEMYAQALEVFDGQYEYKTLRNVVSIAESVELSRRRDNLSWSHHAEVAALDTAAQDALLDLAERNSLSKGDLRSAVQEYKRNVQVVEQGASFHEADIDALPAHAYQVIYADPPWRYEHSVSDSRRIENQYPTMDLHDICALPVGRLADLDAVLFLWATSPKLAEAMEVIAAWGFTYRTCMVWDKERIGMGYYARQQHELLLIAGCGSPPIPDPEVRPASVQRIRRDNEHSKKPDEFYTIIDRMYPGMAKVELFARQQQPGWAAWGNQV